MKERPILFNDEMVRAILGGRKTQTRRLVKPQPTFFPSAAGGKWGWYGGQPECPYGKPGDRLWVREAFHKCPHCSPDEFVAYRSIGCRDSVYGLNNEDDGPLRPKCAAHGWKPSIHMPRWASRITLEITGVRVERLHDISEDDAMAEGFPFEGDQPSPRDNFSGLWESINGTDSWDANPWVWVIEFRRVSK